MKVRKFKNERYFKWIKEKIENMEADEWMAKEICYFQSIKRTYGEYVSATKLQNMVKREYDDESIC